MTARRELIEYLAGDDDELSCYLNEQDAAGLARLCATTLLVNGPRVRELLGVDVAEHVLAETKVSKTS
jgi:hypothetical protein